MLQRTSSPFFPVKFHNLYNVPIRISSRGSAYLREMGLQGQLNDLSSVSIPLLLVATLATCLNYLRSSFSDLLHSVRPSRFHSHHHLGDGLFDAVGSELAGLILLAEQINLNRDLSHRFGDEIDDALGGGSDCVVCLSNLKVGDRVRRLSCGHVFHKECLDGWLEHLNFNCPLCRSPLVSDERASVTRRHVVEDVVSWVAMR